MICVPQSSAVITQLKGSVNWDDGIEKEMNLCVSVRVGEYFFFFFWAAREKTRRGRSADGNRCDSTVAKASVYI